MRSDYLFYLLALVFFLITITSIVLVADETARNLWAAGTVILGLVSAGVGYYQRPKAKPTETISEVPPVELGDSHAKEAHVAESVEKHAEPTATPPSASTMPAQVVAPGPLMVPTPVGGSASAKSELTAIKGINEKRAAQLKEAGINNIDALANASADDLAKSLMVSPKIIRMWIGSAKKLQERTD
jgi:predicted flap endonuclease-1-like 5' DNA nuclease